ncbi:nuclear autoantigenic sperm protein-like isoform X1 [Durio zibethinus]|uniref:Nuclear autoantigenic sperm protein-like isoform X1 n=1 Tax=Durio zibethinus TaxID=66656 RepID=A0A6P6BDS3_DURZI|nr:nuclear autoantigenic sperm protein-like isoform X1 [Durio zibethinus]
MADEEVTAAAASPEASVTMTEETPDQKIGETLETQGSIEATIESAVQGGTESTCNNNNNAGSSVIASDVEREKTLEFADELTEKGSKAFKENDFAEAADCFSRSLEIRVSHHGELAIECLDAYYLYGRALLYKAQEEADPLVSVPKKDGETQQESNKEGSIKSAVTPEFSVASVSSNSEQDGAGKDEEEDDDSDTDDVAEADEDVDESDLDLAWKMLDVARAIAEKQQLGDTMEKVDVLSALAEVALEREDIESSLSDYQKALSILERLVEPDHRQIAELNFRICMCLEIGSKPQEAIPYCQKAILVCKSRLQRLTNEVKISSGSASSSAASELDDGVQQSSNGSQTVKSVKDKEAEVETLAGLAEDLEKKLEDLQQLASNPKSIIAEILGIATARARGSEKSASPAAVSSSQMATANSNGHFDSPVVSTAHTNGAAAVTHLGVVGRGVKRVTGAVESSSIKKPAIDPSSDKGDGSSAS